MKGFVTLLLCLCIMSCGTALAGKTLQRYELEFADYIDTEMYSDTVSMCRYEANYLSLDTEIIKSVFLDGDAEIVEQNDIGELYSSKDGERVLRFYDVYICNQDNIAMTYLKDSRIANLDVGYLTNWGSLGSDEIISRCMENELDFMSRDEAIQLVKDTVNAMGIYNVEVMNLFGVNADDMNGQHIEDTQIAVDHYEVYLRQTVDNIPINYTTYANRTENIYELSGPQIEANITKDGLNSISCFNILVPYPVSESERIISCKQACDMLKEYYAHKFLTYPNKVVKVELLYYQIKTDDDLHVRLDPVWAFTINAFDMLANGDGSFSKYYKDFCLIDAISGEMYVAP